jgi:hypothetical protein
MKNASSLIILLAFAGLANLTANAMNITPPFDSPERPDLSHSVPMRGEADFGLGRILAVDAFGYGAPAADEAGLIVLGRIRSSVEAFGLLDGERFVSFDVGVFAFRNSGAHPATAESYGRPLFIEDDVTVSADPGENAVMAGFCRGFEGSLVWVDMKTLPMVSGFFGSHPAANFRITAGAGGAPVFQLFNATREIWQTVQLSGADGAEALVIA